MTRRDLIESLIASPALVDGHFDLRAMADQVKTVVTAAPEDAVKPYRRIIKPLGPKAHVYAFGDPEQDARITIVHAAFRSSKTYATLVKMLLLSVYQVEGLRVLAGVSVAALKANMLGELRELVGEHNFQFNEQAGELLLCGVRWIVVGAGYLEEMNTSHAERVLRSNMIGICVVDEASLVPRDFVYMALNRMQGKNKRLYLITNAPPPDSEGRGHWLTREFVYNQSLKDAGIVRCLTWGLSDNPNLNEEYKTQLAASFTGEEYQRYILGEWPDLPERA